MEILQDIIGQLQLRNQQVLNKLKEIRGNPTIILFLEQIDRSTVDLVYNMLNNPDFVKERNNLKNPKNLDILLDSGGGDADAAYHIAKLLHNHFQGEITYIVPRIAKSAATLLVSGGNRIIMGPTSELGPLDPQILTSEDEWISAKAVQSTLELIKKYIRKDFKLATIIASRINPLILGEYESTLKITEEYQKELLHLRMFSNSKNDKKTVNSIVKKFSEGYTHHGRIIDYDEARMSNLIIEELDVDAWNLIWELYMHYTQIIYLVKVMKMMEKAKEFDME